MVVVLLMRLLMGLFAGMMTPMVMGMLVVVVLRGITRMFVVVVVVLVLRGRAMAKGMKMLKRCQTRWFIMLTVRSPCILAGWLADGDHIWSLGLVFSFDEVLDEFRRLLGRLTRLGLFSQTRRHSERPRGGNLAEISR